MHFNMGGSPGGGSPFVFHFPSGSSRRSAADVSGRRRNYDDDPQQSESSHEQDPLQSLRNFKIPFPFNILPWQLVVFVIM